MNIFKNIPGGIKLLSHLKYLNKYKKPIKEAREAGDFQNERELILKATSTWSKALANNAGAEIEILGKENLPTEGPVVFMANHQGYADIVVLCAVIDTIQIGYVARDNLVSVPFYGKWVDRVRSVTINRKNPKDGLKAINRGVELLKDGFSLIIFPEGTRSRAPEMNEFKAGAMKLATKAKVPIIPITLDGTWKLFEEKGCMQKGLVRVLIHPPIETKDLSREEERRLSTRVQDIIQQGLEILRK